MKVLKASDIAERVARMCVEANCDIEPDMMAAFDKAIAREASPTGRDILVEIKENALLGKAETVPTCQDTGFAVFFVELGAGVAVEGGTIPEAINAGVRKGYKEGYLRGSIVRDPILDRSNTGDNTPAVVHIDHVAGEALRITMMAKGGGSENMSRLKMLRPADGLQGVKDFVLYCVENMGGNACPPVVVGVGVGGTFEKAAQLAKRSLLRPVGSPNPDPKLDAIEKELLETVNKTGIGPMGLGGAVTAFDVHISTHPCHIASLPVAVNIECHAHRHKEIVL